MAFTPTNSSYIFPRMTDNAAGDQSISAAGTRATLSLPGKPTKSWTAETFFTTQHTIRSQLDCEDESYINILVLSSLWQKKSASHRDCQDHLPVSDQETARCINCQHNLVLSLGMDRIMTREARLRHWHSLVTLLVNCQTLLTGENQLLLSPGDSSQLKTGAQISGSSNIHPVNKFLSALTNLTNRNTEVVAASCRLENRKMVAAIVHFEQDDTQDAHNYERPNWFKRLLIFFMNKYNDLVSALYKHMTCIALVANPDRKVQSSPAFERREPGTSRWREVLEQRNGALTLQK